MFKYYTFIMIFVANLNILSANLNDLMPPIIYNEDALNIDDISFISTTGTSIEKLFTEYALYSFSKEGAVLYSKNQANDNNNLLGVINSSIQVQDNVDSNNITIGVQNSTLRYNNDNNVSTANILLMQSLGLESNNIIYINTGLGLKISSMLDNNRSSIYFKNSQAIDSAVLNILEIKHFSPNTKFKISGDESVEIYFTDLSYVKSVILSSGYYKVPNRSEVNLDVSGDIMISGSMEAISEITLNIETLDLTDKRIPYVSIVSESSNGTVVTLGLNKDMSWQKWILEVNSMSSNLDFSSTNASNVILALNSFQDTYQVNTDDAKVNFMIKDSLDMNGDIFITSSNSDAVDFYIYYLKGLQSQSQGLWADDSNTTQSINIRMSNILINDQQANSNIFNLKVYGFTINSNPDLTVIRNGLLRIEEAHPISSEEDINHIVSIANGYKKLMINNIMHTTYNVVTNNSYNDDQEDYLYSISLSMLDDHKRLDNILNNFIVKNSFAQVVHALDTIIILNNNSSNINIQNGFAMGLSTQILNMNIVDNNNDWEDIKTSGLGLSLYASYMYNDLIGIQLQAQHIDSDIQNNVFDMHAILKLGNFNIISNIGIMLSAIDNFAFGEDLSTSSIFYNMNLQYLYYAKSYNIDLKLDLLAGVNSHIVDDIDINNIIYSNISADKGNLNSVYVGGNIILSNHNLFNLFNIMPLKLDLIIGAKYINMPELVSHAEYLNHDVVFDIDSSTSMLVYNLGFNINSSITKNIFININNNFQFSNITNAYVINMGLKYCI